ncbi:MAG: general secretion pathway protein GspK [Candidatus Omnitrophica bacterium]|nr:general secretion pathway protein GspK [Candidatus Omnitrophota bacterium]
MKGSRSRLRERSAYPLAGNIKGSILILTLWSLGLLVIFAIYLGVGVRQKLTMVYSLDERSKLRLIAESGIKKAILQIERAKKTDEDYDSFSDDWSHSLGIFKDIRTGDGSYSVYYTFMNDKTGRAESRYGAVDEESKLNINKADQKVLRQFCRVVLGSSETEAQELAASIVDWRDKDSELSIPLGSAEDMDYRALYYPYEAKDDKFEVLEELFLVKGIDKDIYKKMEQYVTIYGKGKVNINTAPAYVLMALGLNARLTDKIISYRYGQDNMIGTADDGVFTSTGAIIPKLSQSVSLSESEIAELSRVVEQHLTVLSEHFNIRSKAALDGRRRTHEIVCIFERAGRILYWHES